MTIARHHCISSRHANRDAARTDAARFDMRPALAMLPGILLAGLIAWAHGHTIPGFVIVVVACSLATFLATWLVFRLSPHAAGSGIPHVEAVLHPAPGRRADGVH